ncbi:CocE/NonD family hydrolase [SAR92 clade bacterium H246]
MNREMTGINTAMNQPQPITCESSYLTLRDGVRLAASVWLDKQAIKHSGPYPAIVTTTRYWRTSAFQGDRPEYQLYYPCAAYYLSRGYSFVAIDARGTGASFGYRGAEMSPTEVEDIGDVIRWVAEQEWCDGRVATEGTSYTASTTLYSLVTAPTALKLGVCRAPDFDGYRHLLAPGGIVNHWFIDAWGETTAALDQNNAELLLAKGYMPPPVGGADNLLGVRPVDDDSGGTLLAQAIREHQANFNLAGQESTLAYIDNVVYDYHRVFFDPEYQEKIEQSDIPLVIRCGWHDAGTQLGALAMFCSFNMPLRVTIDPWNHSGNGRADPFAGGDGTTAGERSFDDVWGSTADWLDIAFGQNNGKTALQVSNQGIPALHSRVVDYYTLGENRWKSTPVWPLPNTQWQRWYLASNHQLSQKALSDAPGCDVYQVDPLTTTGRDNRWFAQARLKPILFPDRREEDKKLLVYDTPPLGADTEITGHPVVSLQLSSSATDGQFFAYLETVDPDGRVRLLTEGQLRGLHRKISDQTPPYRMFGPYHSLMKKDAMPMVPGEITEISFDLFPISVLLKKGQRIRLAIAGADCDVFAPIPGCEAPELTIQRTSVHASYLDLPIIPIEEH